MSENVWEWCYDWYGNYPTGAQENPTGADSGSYRVVRGGGWSHSVDNCRSANRLYEILPNNERNTFGFRVVRRAQ